MKKWSIILFLSIFFGFCACKQGIQNVGDETEKVFTLIYTNDEHGWLEGNDEFGGADGMLNHWMKNENYDRSEKFLVLSGGDTWSGPAISNWFKGKPMIEIMSAMGYDASAIGNHEFDARVENLQELVKMAKFPFLAANITEKVSGEIPSFAKPFVIIEKQEVKFGIIGLGTMSTPSTTFPEYVENYNFTSYKPAIQKYAEEARKSGAEVLIILGHICEDEMDEISDLAAELDVLFIGGGHCHQAVLRNDGKLVRIQARSYFKSYGVVEFKYKPASKSTEIISATIKENSPGVVENEISPIIDYWVSRIDSILDVTIGYSEKEIGKSSVEMANMITDAWLNTFPNADVSITNSGGIRQDIEMGDITLETIVGVLPFNNSIVQLELKGSELLDCIYTFELGGMSTRYGNKLADGTPIHADSIYIVLTTDYLYTVPENHFARYDSTPYNTSVHYRDPVIHWIKMKNTSKTNPINKYLDYQPRR